MTSRCARHQRSRTIPFPPRDWQEIWRDRGARGHRLVRRCGEVHCLVGENGSGKSTLIKIISGVHVPDRGGSITIEGSRHSSLTPQLAKSLGVQVIFQDLSLFPNLSVLENIAIDCELPLPFLPPPRRAMSMGRDRGACSAQCAAPSRHQGRRAPGGATPDRRHLSRVGRQRPDPVHGRTDCVAHTARGRAVARECPPAKAFGVAIVFVSHRLEEIVEIAERVTVLRDGCKVGTFPASEVDDHGWLN